MTAPEPGLYVPTRGNDVGSGINKSGVGGNAVNTDSNDSISVNNPSINKNSLNNANAGINASGNISINRNSVNNANISAVNTSVNNNGGIDKLGINKSSGNQSKTGANSVNAKRAKFEEDIKKEPILQTIMDVFDGELLG